MRAYTRETRCLPFPSCLERVIGVIRISTCVTEGILNLGSSRCEARETACPSLHQSHLSHAVNPTQKVTGPLNKSEDMQQLTTVKRPPLRPKMFFLFSRYPSCKKPYCLAHIRIHSRRESTHRSAHRNEEKKTRTPLMSHSE